MEPDTVGKMECKCFDAKYVRVGEGHLSVYSQKKWKPSTRTGDMAAKSISTTYCHAMIVYFHSKLLPKDCN